MKTPPLLLAAAIGFWGWQSNQVMVAALLALALESPRVISARHAFTQKNLNRASDLCALVCLLLAVYFFVAHRSVRAIFMTVQWLPVAFAPLALIQGYHTADRLNVSGFFMVIRRKYPDGRPSGPFVNFSYPYLALCILGASTANIFNPTFYAGLVLLTGMALWRARAVRFARYVWGAALVAAILAGYFGHIGLHRLQLLIEDKGMEWFMDALREERDPFRNTTAMGEVGVLKQSNRILYRVKRTRGVAVPLLLRGAAFNAYRNAVWYARQAPFKQALKPGSDGRTWQLAEDQTCARTIHVAGKIKKGRGILPLPNGSVRLSDMPAANITRNRLGGVRVNGGPELVNYAVCYTPGGSMDGLPDKDDLQIPMAEQKTIDRVIAAWGLSGQSPPAAARIIKDKFATDFGYTLDLSGPTVGQTPIAVFLTQTRAGHCEYFGTATVLILRALGIPARYVSGYAVQEMDPWSRDLVVRSRHAHAWAQAYIDGRWVSLDTTPATWVEFESSRAGFWQPVTDLWAWVRYRVTSWLRADKAPAGDYERYLLWPVLALLVVLGGVLLRRKRVKKGGSTVGGRAATERLPGDDSPFYLVQSRLQSWGFSRARPEPFTDFIARIGRGRPAKRAALDKLEGLLARHYRYRFDPQGAHSSEMEAFRQGVMDWLDETRARESAGPGES